MNIDNHNILESIKKNIKESFIVSLLLIVFAIVLLINPDNFINTAINVFGYIGIFTGVLSLVYYFRIEPQNRFLSHNFMNGILLITLGLISFMETNMVKEMITLLIGGYLIARNTSRANMALNLRAFSHTLWIYLIVISFINILLGFLIIVNPFTSLIKINSFMAIMIIVSEGFIIIENLVLLYHFRKIEK